MIEIIRLFRVVVVKEKKDILYIKNGILYTAEVKNTSKIEKELILTSKQLNSSFHKSWKKIRDASIEQLVIEQCMHYITTYGFEALGIYNKKSVYIPVEKLKLPKIDIDKIELIVINGITVDELKDRIISLLSFGVALADKTIKDLLKIIDEHNIKIDIDIVKNKEFKMILCDKLKVFPKDPVELLRFLIYRMTGETLLIKNTKLIEKIKIADKSFSLGSDDNYKKMASIFYRFKPLFLAMKNKYNKTIINKIRKLAKIYHKPMEIDYFNSITQLKEIDIDKFKSELKKVNIFRKIRLLNSINYRMSGKKSILYKIRNGKGFATKIEKDDKHFYKDVYNILIDDIKSKINKKIYIPDHVKYALPVSEKQFSENLPIGSSIEIDKDMIFGVFWKNDKCYRVDLDLSLVSNSEKLGWDADYGNKSILFSGDITDAPNGATELYYIGKSGPGIYLVMLNYYNYSKDFPVSFKIFIAKEKPKRMKKNYMVHPNNVLLTVNSEIDKKQKLLGLLKIEESKVKFYFCEINIGMSITSYYNEYVKRCRKYLNNYYSNMVTLNDIIDICDKDDCDVDLSPKNITKDSILKILKA